MMGTYRKIQELKDELKTETSGVRRKFISEYILLLERIAQYNFGIKKKEKK